MEMERSEEEQIDLRDYLRTMMKHRWTILTVFAVIFLSVAIFSFTATPIYRGTVRLIIEKENPKVVSMEEVMRVDSSGTDYYQTQYQIIESRSVAREVIRRLQLDKNEEFVPKPSDSTISNLGRSVTEAIGYLTSFLKTEEPEKEGGKAGVSEPDSPLVFQFMGRLKVSPIRNSRLVDVSFESKDPALAARIANAVGRAYIDLNLETKLKATQDAVAWLNTRLEEERKKVDVAEVALLRYKEQHSIITAFSSDVENITAQKLAELNKQVIDAEARRVEAETRYRQAAAVKANSEGLDSIPEVLNSELIRQIKTMEVDVYKRMSELSKKYGQNHPQMIALQNELNTLQVRKNKEVKRVVNSLYNEYRVTQARENSLKSALGRQKGESLSLNQKAIGYSVLKREAESAREMYDLLLKRFKETSITEEIKTGNIRIIDPAEVPKAPVKPMKGTNILLGLVVGLFMGVGLAFFLEYLDNTIKIPEDIKHYLQIPYLGPIPVFPKGEDHGNPEEKPEDIITLSSPKSSVSEFYRSIRTAIQFSAADSPQVMMISSAGPSEGKTVTVSNLAVTMAQAGNSVLILDCDMRKPKLHKVFETARDKGMSNILVGDCGLEEAVIHTKVPGIDLIPCGQIPPNPSEILGSHRMVKFIEEVRSRYERIFLDTPPITAVTDAVILSRLVDGVILVIRAGDTYREVVKNGLNQLHAVNARILGAILNAVEMGRDSYYYYRYYNYYYGEDGENGEKKKKTRRKRKTRSHYSELVNEKETPPTTI